MVTLGKIYTRGGDGGETSLGDGSRVAKTDPRITAIGAVDEANAVIGVARTHAGGEAGGMLARIQNDLFDAGADLCRPGDGDDGGPGPLRINQTQIDRLEDEIDRLNKRLQPLDSFVLPGGSAASAHLHHARTVVRRAECEVIELAASGPVNPLCRAYLNRLSDYLFVLARDLNGGGKDDILWRPGENR